MIFKECLRWGHIRFIMLPPANVHYCTAAVLAVTLGYLQSETDSESDLGQQISGVSGQSATLSLINPLPTREKREPAVLLYRRGSRFGNHCNRRNQSTE
jgi:hypothetical protein